VTAFLLDVNVLIALVREDHSDHQIVKRWFKRLDGSHWATCPLTQAGFVRIVSNPRFLKRPPEVSEAVDMLKALTSLPGHRFWPMNVAFAEATQSMHMRLVGHQQVTDAYLLGLAVGMKGKLATLDRGIRSLADAELNSYVSIIG
jgi:uncharacterized protein